MTIKTITLGGKTVKFGRKRPVSRPQTFKLCNYLLRSLPTPPPAVDYAPKAIAALHDIMGNDQLADCHDDKTEVLTESGWTPWPEYDGESLLGTMNPETRMLEFQAPISVTRREHRGPMVFAAHKRLDFALTPNHRMLCQPYEIPKPYVPGGAGYGEQRFVTVDSLPTRSLLPGAPVGFLGATLERVRIGDRSWDGWDLVRLIALVLSDGYVRSGPNKNVVSFCCFREDRYDFVASFAHRIGLHQQPSRKGVWSFSDGDLAEWLRQHAYTGNVHKSPFKRVPDLIRATSQEQTAEFLKFFGDQTATKNDGRSFSTTSERMSGDLQELLLRVGKRSSVYRREPRPHGDFQSQFPEFSITESQRSDVSLTRSARNPGIERGEYRGEVFCATVPNSTLITRRNGRVLVSGNCVIAAGGHIVGVETGNTGPLFHATLAQIIAQYSAIAGYVAGDPSTDNGTNLVDALDYWVQHGFPNGTKLMGYVAVNPADKAELATAIYLFENMLFGLNLPDRWVAPFPSGDGFAWDTAGAPDPNNGHAVMATGYTPNGPSIDTWGMLGTMTWGAVSQYCSAANGGELYVLLTPDQIGKAQAKAPNGLAWSQLISDFDSIGGQVPVPPPPVPPTPPPVPVTVTGPTFATALNACVAALQASHPLMSRAQAELAVSRALKPLWP